MGVLYARVDGTWVPVSVGMGFPPAYIGPRPGQDSDAFFGLVPGTVDSGFVVRNGRIFAQMRATDLFSINTPTLEIVLIQPTAPTHPAMTVRGEVRTAGPGGGVVWTTGRDNNPSSPFSVFVNAGAWRMTWGGSEIVAIDTAGGINCTAVASRGQHRSSWDPGTTTWDFAHFLAYPALTNNQARFAGHSPGVAPQLRVVASVGSKWGVVNESSSAWAAIGASAFEVGSSLAVKREVRSLGPSRERIIVHHDLGVDRVPAPDVMSLRPVAFRPKVPALRIVPTNGDSYDAEDPTSWRLDEQVGILGHEGTRERLGLIAEEVQHVLPSAVSHDVDGNAVGIDYAQVTVALLEHVQRLTEEVATLRYRITELEGSSP